MIANLRKYWDNYAEVMEDRAIELIKKAGGSMPVYEFEDNYLPPFGGVLIDHLLKHGLAHICYFDITIHLREKTKNK